jgi:hypothetical protein
MPIEKIKELCFILVPQRPYSPDLAPYDFFLFGHLKQHSGGNRFTREDQMIIAVRKFFGKTPLQTFQNMMDDWQFRLRRYISLPLFEYFMIPQTDKVRSDSADSNTVPTTAKPSRPFRGALWQDDPPLNTERKQDVTSSRVRALWSGATSPQIPTEWVSRPAIRWWRPTRFGF